VVGYLGHLDVLILWPFAKLRRVPIVWDAFISLYDTIVEDRKLIGRCHPFAFFLKSWEWLACRAADLVMLDTKTHAEYFAEAYNIPRAKLAAVFVGAEPEIFSHRLHRASELSTKVELTVLFYGQFIPLHGIETIIRAAHLLRSDPVQWVLIGQGQAEPEIRRMLYSNPLSKLQWIPWIPYTQLPEWIGRADVCLGIFGASGKASRVIPNKVFQILASGKPLITRDSPAIRELLSPDASGIYLVPPDDPEALAGSISWFSSRHRMQTEEVLHRDVIARISPSAVGAALLDQLVASFSNDRIEIGDR
jgi:glycosyltransferase involved in cell wall biosynthesis